MNFNAFSAEFYIDPLNSIHWTFNIIYNITVDVKIDDHNSSDHDGSARVYLATL